MRRLRLQTEATAAIRNLEATIRARSIVVGVLAAAILSSCSADAGPSPTAPAPSRTPALTPSASPTAMSTPTTTPTPAATATPTVAPTPTPSAPPAGIVVERDVPFTTEVRCEPGDPSEGTCRMRLDIWRDRSTTAGPIVITLHGRPRTRADLEPIAKLLAQRGAVVFNADYRGSAEVERGYPASFEDVACAVRFARAHAADYGGDRDRRIVLVGHSFGTYVGSIVALDGDDYNHHCVNSEGSAEPDAFVGLSGSYHWHTIPIWNTFFGTTYANDPERWEDGDPHTHIGGNPDSLWRFLIEKDDPILEAGSSEEFHDALLDAGYDSKLRRLGKAGHFTMLQLDGHARTAADIIAGLGGLPPE